MIGSEIITKFQLYVDDSTELSADEELALLNKVYHRVCADRPWEIFRKTATGTLSTSVPYVSLPADFGYFTENDTYGDNQVTIDNNAAPKVVYIIEGNAYTPYQIINYANRRKYVNTEGYAYLDLANSRLYFTKQPTSEKSYEFDYIAFPTDLTLATSPVFPARFHDILVHLMAVDSMIIQMFPKAQSYAAENQAKANEILADMCYYNSQLSLM